MCMEMKRALPQAVSLHLGIGVWVKRNSVQWLWVSPQSLAPTSFHPQEKVTETAIEKLASGLLLSQCLKWVNLSTGPGLRWDKSLDNICLLDK